MNEQQQETLSALFDGETSTFETRRLLDELSDADLERWHRYQVISDASQNKLVDNDFSFSVVDAVAAAISDEDVPSLEPAVEKTSARQSWFKPLVGFAAAASVAFVAVLGIQSPEMVTPGFVANGNVSISQLPITGDLGLSAVSGTAASTVLAADIKAIDANKAENADRLKYYLQQHTQHAAYNNGRGLLPMARMENGEY